MRKGIMRQVTLIAVFVLALAAMLVPACQKAPAYGYVRDVITTSTPTWISGVLAGTSSNVLGAATNTHMGTAIGVTGVLKQAGGAITAAVSKVTVLTAASGTFTTQATTNSVLMFLVGAGGGAGSSSNTSTNISIGSGGGAGSLTIKAIAVSPSTGYAYVVGPAGAAGAAQTTQNAAGTAGSTGSATNITIGATVVTAPGGSGGAGAIADATRGGAVIALPGGSVSLTGANGDGYLAGAPGGNAIYLSATVGVSGGGGIGPLGGGASSNTTAGAGNAGGSYGCGGAGAVSTTTTGYAGGAGATGVIIIYEYY